MILRTKEQLDKLTEEQITRYRYKLLSDDNYTKGSDLYNYIIELEFYTDERFDTPNKLFNKWSEDVKRGADDELTLSGKKLIVSIGLDGFKWIKQQEKEKYGDLKFLKEYDI